MNIVITIEEKDIMKNPDILDMAKSFARSLEEPAEAQPVEPVAEAPEVAPAEEPAEEPTMEQPAESVAEEGAEVTISIEEVRAAIAKVSKKHGAATAKQILKNYGADNLSGLDEKFYSAALEEAKAVL